MREKVSNNSTFSSDNSFLPRKKFFAVLNLVVAQWHPVKSHLRVKHEIGRIFLKRYKQTSLIKVMLSLLKSFDN